MTAKELIQRLKSLPPETVVFALSDGNEMHTYEVTEIEVDRVKTEGRITLTDCWWTCK